MSALLQSLLSGTLSTCASFLTLVAAVLPISWLNGTEPEHGPAPLPVTTPATNGATATNSAVVTSVSLQEVEALRREIELSMARNSAAITSSLSGLEPALAQLQTRQMEAVQSLNRTLLIVAGIFGATSLIGLIGITLILVRALGRFSELAATAAGQHGHLLPAPPSPAALVPGDLAPVSSGAAEQSSARFQGAIDQLNQRIRELEHSLQEGLAHSGRERAEALASSEKGNGVSPASPVEVFPAIHPEATRSLAATESASLAARAAVLVGKGQALLNLDAADQALACFEEVLAFDPANGEALVRQGLAFEKLQNWEQALESYNRAIAADKSLTIAYLYKGGVCNRLQRHQEALDSYEQALQTESTIRMP